MYYLVMDNKKWFIDPLPLEQIKKDFIVKTARLAGDFDLFSKDGLYHLGRLFSKKVDAALYVSQNFID